MGHRGEQTRWRRDRDTQPSVLSPQPFRPDPAERLEHAAGGLLGREDGRPALPDRELAQRAVVVAVAHLHDRDDAVHLRAIDSDAGSVPEIIDEMLRSRHSERQGRVIDHDEEASMETKKREGYF